MKRLLSSLTLLGLISCFASMPIYNSTFSDNYSCLREKAHYILLVDSGDSGPFGGYSPFDTTYTAMKQIGTGLLRMEGTKLGLLLFSNYIDDNFFSYEKMESGFLSKYSEMVDQNYYLGGNTNLENILSSVIGRFSEFNAKEGNDAVNKLVIIHTDPSFYQSVGAGRLRDSGVEIFSLGGSPYTPSLPTGSHFVPLLGGPNEGTPDFFNIRSKATDLLTLLRKQEGDTCYAWGFGQAHISTFDGRLFDFAGVGDYYLFNSRNNGEDHLSVQVRQYSRSYNEELQEGVTQIRAVSVELTQEAYIISIDPDSKIFRIQYREQANDMFYDLKLDDDFRLIDDSGRLSTGLYKDGTESRIEVSRIDPSATYLVEIRQNSGAVVRIALSDYSSFISVKPVGSSYGESLGLCGKYDGCASNDFTKRDGSSLSVEIQESNRKMKKYLPEFIESWRIKFSESKFNLKGFEEYLPSESWKPLTSKKSHKNADSVCNNLPSSLSEECLYDVGARGHVYASLSTKFLMLQVCDSYCSNVERKFHPYFEVEKSCKLHCDSLERQVDIHRTFNITNDDETYRSRFYELRSTETSSIFKPNANMGGKYVFSFRTNDYCYDNDRNVTFQITCPKAPVIKAFSYFDESENEIEGEVSTSSSVLGGASVFLFGSIDEIKPNYRISWKVIGGNLTYWDEGKIMTYTSFLDEANSFLLYSKTLTPIFRPKRIATYIIEMAVNDGCRVTRTNVTVKSNCQKCNPIIQVDRFQKNLWNKPINSNGYWFDSSFSMEVLETTVSNSFSRKWSLVSKDGDIVVPKSNMNEYDIIKIIVPRRTINSTTSRTTNRNENRYTNNQNGYPFTQSKSPYTIPELYTEVENFDYTETTETTTIEIFEEETLTKCSIYITNPTSSSTDVEFDDNANFGNDELAMCTGFYTFEASVKDRCESNSAERHVKDSVILHLDCGLPPRAYLSCPHTVEFNYNTLQFPSVTLDGSETYDVRGSNVDYLRYSWSIVSAPQTSTAKITNANQNTRSFRPDTRGTYTIRMTASNQCNRESAVVDVYAKCVDPPAVVAAVEIESLTYNGIQFSPKFNLTSSSAHQFPSALTYTWRLYSSPSYSQQLIGFVPGSSFSSSSSSSTLFSPSIGGQYLVGVSVFDRCQPAVEKNITLQFNCPGTISNTIDNIPNFNYDYTNDQFTALVVSGAASTVNPVPYTIVPIHSWSYVSYPVGFSPSTSSANTFNVQPTIPGTYTIRHRYSDGCQYSFSDTTFQALCTNNLTPTPSATTAPFTVYTAVTLDDTSSSQFVEGYEWTIILSPEGSTANIVNRFNKVATITPDVSGIYLINLRIDDGCSSASQNLTLNVVCPTVTYRPTPISNSPVSIYSKGKFARVELSDSLANIGSLVYSDFEYLWEMIQAPRGSAFEPTDISNVTSDITSEIVNNTQLIPGTTNLYRKTVTIRRVVESYRRVRYVELMNSQPTSFASCFFPDIPGVYRARITIVDDSYPFSDSCYPKVADISVEARCNSAPSINAPDQTITLTQNKLTRVQLDASQTIDADGDPLKFTWKVLPSSSNVPEDMDISIVTQTDSPIASFIVRTQGVYTIELTVTDGCSTVVKNVVITAQCAADDYTLSPKQIKKNDEMRMIVAAYDGIQISNYDFEYLQKSVEENCTGIYEWKLVSFSDSEDDIITVEPFTSTGGFIATVVIVPIVGTILIVAGVAFILMKTGVIGGK